MSDRDFSKCQVRLCRNKTKWLSDWITESVEGPAGTTLAWCNKHRKECEVYARNWRPLTKLATVEDFYLELES